jgi:Flp pilus assembly protein TadD
VVAARISLGKKAVCLALSAVWRSKSSVLTRLPLDEQALAAQPPVNAVSAETRNIAELRTLLRRYPYWREGHRLLAENNLAVGDIATAYASAHCFSALSGATPDSEATVHFILGRCFLRRGDANSALTHFELARSLTPTNLAILEEEAAALMLLGNKEKAQSVLRQIPEDKLSPEARITLSYLTNPSR